MKLILFRREGCIPCRAIEIFLKRDLNIQPNIIVDVDSKVENSLLLTSRFKINSVPVLMLVDDNLNEIEIVKGMNPIKIKEICDMMKENEIC